MLQHVDNAHPAPATTHPAADTRSGRETQIPIPTHSPFLPLMSVLREFLRRSELRVKDVVNDDSGTLDHFLEGRLDQVVGRDVKSALARYEDLFAAFLTKIGQAQPVFLVLEHLDTMDEAVLRLIGRLAGEAKKFRPLLIVTWRDEALAENTFAPSGRHLASPALDCRSADALVDFDPDCFTGQRRAYERHPAGGDRGGE